MKNFNPKLKGMSLVTTIAYSSTVDGYNMALSGTKTFNLTNQGP